jgi:hypothetical protein
MALEDYRQPFPLWWNKNPNPPQSQHPKNYFVVMTNHYVESRKEDEWRKVIPKLQKLPLKL